MSFFNRASSILRRAASKNINHEISAPKPSIFQMIRCISESPGLFVGGLSRDIDDASFREAMKKYGEVVDANVFPDDTAGDIMRSGYVSFTKPEAVAAVIRDLDKPEMLGYWERRNGENLGFYEGDGGGDEGDGGGDGSGGGGYGGNAGGYGGGGDSFGDTSGFGADGNHADQFDSSGGLINSGGSDGGFSQ